MKSDLSRHPVQKLGPGATEIRIFVFEGPRILSNYRKISKTLVSSDTCEVTGYPSQQPSMLESILSANFFCINSSSPHRDKKSQADMHISRCALKLNRDVHIWLAPN
ncbi:hypothetical protein M758_12G128000 [Ceratodon purpureus]|nr:hypothetical protein M758_12G128000 [Ceratodon purpureus]